MRKSYTLTINGTPKTVKAAPDSPLLWALRDGAGLTGTKYGCGVGLCGACSVHIDGQVQRSCTVTLASLEDGAQIQTIEGAYEADPEHPVFAAWRALDVPQCGYCQTGQIMAAITFLQDNPDPSENEVRQGMANYCRCGTYNQIAAAISKAAADRTTDKG